MTENEFFPARPETRPMIYAYEEDNPKYAGMLKVGFASAGVEKLVSMGFEQLYHQGKKTEWFRCSANAVRAAWLAVRNRMDNVEQRTLNFTMRPEQKAAVEKTIAYYASAAKETKVKRTPKFLWNAKMRFGKTFATYQLAKRLGAKRVLVLTFKSAVQSAWREDLMTHVDFEGWQFISKEVAAEAARSGRRPIGKTPLFDKSRPIVCFGSFQDFLGYNKETGGIKTREGL